jgi:hypothetical protein
MNLFKRVKFACVEGGHQEVQRYTDYVSQNEDPAHVAKNACNMVCTSSRGSSLPVLRGTSRSTKVYRLCFTK